jgi:hypothetical protein|tara:strand:- start:2375 stop:3121 length:747 start_codon:yes stop_codon:yes gene_type:complete
MFRKTIEFIANQKYVDSKQDQPIPIKLNIPEWYKKLKHSVDKRTVKGCMPFLDSMSTGYLLKVPVDIKIRHNVPNEETGEKDGYWRTGTIESDLMKAERINVNGQKPEIHSAFQLEGSPTVEKNKNLPFYKILNPWIIKTPPGYSCLFVPPLNNSDDRFSIIPGIVDTDTYNQEVNFPIVVNGDKYEVLDTMITKGTPYVQIIPFKRDSWEMKIKGESVDKLKTRSMFFPFTILNNYKKNIWNKKSWT